MREVAGSTPGLDFYLLCESICVLSSFIRKRIIGICGRICTTSRTEILHIAHHYVYALSGLE
jgi:hypothetical protein